uniref:oxidoreductase n=1 Tax=Limnohabitans sp. TaxID=1907725 RepID=UPI004048DFE1
MNNYPHLFKPLLIRGKVIPNRMVMGAMHTRLETMDRPYERLAAFYAERARGEIGLILTGGHSPTPEGVMDPESPVLNDESHLEGHRFITQAVHEAGGLIVLQILHAGRYARVSECVAPSASKARINTYAARAMHVDEIWHCIASFAHTTLLAKKAGYDGVEIMGSEGYLINEFTSAITNQRVDDFGGDAERMMRFPVEVVRAVRAAMGEDGWVVYRISAIDLMHGGLSADEVIELAHRVEAAGADILNTGIGWHESTVPTIAATVPRAAWVSAVRRIKDAVSIPVIASNRINSPDVAHAIVAAGDADLVSMARPLLADPAFARKTRLGQADRINPCIACNQACLDAIFSNSTATCLVNPRAARELDFVAKVPTQRQHMGVVGAGPAGISFAIEAAHRGHAVTLWDEATQVGGQLQMACRVPGKHEFFQLLSYFRVALDHAGVKIKLGHAVDAKTLVEAGCDTYVLATGVLPRVPDIQGINHPKVVHYTDVLQGRVTVGKRVAILGAGGIGFDVAAFLTENDMESTQLASFIHAWGVDLDFKQPGGLAGALPEVKARTGRQHDVFMFQRSAHVMGKYLGRTTGWIHKAKLRRANVQQMVGVTYLRIDDEGLHYQIQNETRVLAVDHVVVCAGQVSNTSLAEDLQALGVTPYLIGGAHQAEELDATRAIDQAMRLALSF